MTTTREPRRGSEARRQAILDAIRDSPDPLSVEDVAARLASRPSTVRTDIEVLRATGALERSPLPGAGRGRPRWGYSIADTTSPYEVLARALAQHVSGGPTPPDVMAEEWLGRIPDHPRATTPDEAVAQAAASLDSLGFTVEVNRLGDEITMTHCPYAQLVGEFPMICDIHGALLSGILRDSGQDVEVESLSVWAREGMCVARLHREDLRPFHTIHGSDLLGVVTEEGPMP